MPVLPLVASIRILSLVNNPRRSPSRIIASAARSFTLPPGLYHSAFAYTRTGPTASAIRLNDSSGVLPINSSVDRAESVGGEVVLRKATLTGIDCDYRGGGRRSTKSPAHQKRAR